MAAPREPCWDLLTDVSRAPEWLTVVSSASLFAVFSFIAPILGEVTGLDPNAVAGALVLLTGTFWADFAWGSGRMGSGWNWEPRLTTMLILWLAFAALLAPHAPKSEFAFLVMLAVTCALVTHELGVAVAAPHAVALVVVEERNRRRERGAPRDLRAVHWYRDRGGRARDAVERSREPCDLERAVLDPGGDDRDEVDGLDREGERDTARG